MSLQPQDAALRRPHTSQTVFPLREGKNVGWNAFIPELSGIEVSGNSGGPVLGSNNEVIGIAVTGAERMDVADATEKHGFIPVNALELLN